MIPRLSHSLRPNGVALGMRWLVVVVIMFGTMISSIGGTNSHGLAAIAAALHTTPPLPDESHEHVHEDEYIAMVNQGAGADHPHHGTDHSHDNAHALPAAWSMAALPLPSWLGLVRPWNEMLQAYRLERPPMG